MGKIESCEITLRMEQPQESVETIPGTFYFLEPGGSEHAVDFNKVAAAVDKKDPHLVHCQMFGPAKDVFPDIHAFVDALPDICGVGDCYTPGESDVAGIESLSYTVTGLAKAPENTPYFEFETAEDGTVTCNASKALLMGITEFIYEV